MYILHTVCTLLYRTSWNCCIRYTIGSRRHDTTRRPATRTSDDAPSPAMMSEQAFSASAGVSAILVAGVSMLCSAMICMATYSCTFSRRTCCPVPPAARSGCPDKKPCVDLLHFSSKPVHGGGVRQGIHSLFSFFIKISNTEKKNPGESTGEIMCCNCILYCMRRT